MDTYDDPRFGAEQQFITDLTGALNGTVGATVLQRYRMKKAASITGVFARCKVGGTDAVRQIIVGTASAGGAATGIGTATLGTQADLSTKDLSITGDVAAGEEIVISHLGTGAEPWNLELQVYYKEKFVNA